MGGLPSVVIWVLSRIKQRMAEQSEYDKKSEFAQGLGRHLLQYDGGEKNLYRNDKFERLSFLMKYCVVVVSYALGERAPINCSVLLLFFTCVRLLFVWRWAPYRSLEETIENEDNQNTNVSDKDIAERATIIVSAAEGVVLVLCAIYPPEKLKKEKGIFWWDTT